MAARAAGTPGMRRPGLLRLTIGAAVLALTVAACEKRSPLRIRPGPVVRQQVFAAPQPYLGKVAVIPLQPIPSTGLPQPSAAAGDSATGDPAALIEAYLTDAFQEAGVAAVSPNDVVLSFTGAGLPVPRQDARAAAERMAQDFGATSVLLGRMIRFRERQGSAAGATYPASVAFEVSLHEAPSGRRLWTGRFDETQQTLSGSVFRAREYPGGGSRWLTAQEFARWGARRVVQAILAVPAPQVPEGGQSEPR